MRKPKTISSSTSARFLSMHLLFLILIALAWPHSTPASPLPAVGDGQQIFIAHPSSTDPNITQIYHLDLTQKIQKTQKAATYPSKISKRGFTPIPNGAWLIFEDQQIWTLRINNTMPPLPTTYHIRNVAQLPLGVTPISTAAHPQKTNQLWIFARIESLQSLNQIDLGPTKNKNGKIIKENIKPAPPTPTRETRLLQIVNGHINRIKLPQPLPPFTQAWIISPQGSEQVPLLILTDPLHQKITVFFPKNNQLTWHPPKIFHLKQPQQELQFIRAQSQLIMASRDKTLKPFQVKTWNLRQDLDQKQYISTLKQSLPKQDAQPDGQTLTLPPQNPWALLPIASPQAGVQAVAWIALPPNNSSDHPLQNIITSASYLDGKALTFWQNTGKAPTTIAALTSPAPVILALSLIFFSFILLVIWKRDEKSNQLNLPPDQLICDTSRRFIAALIDFIPCLWISMAIYGVTATQIGDLWQMKIQEWHQLAPVALTVAIYTTHTLICELLTKRTLGKWLLHLKVHSISGENPSIKQILTRNFFKIFELFAYFLLLIAILTPYRQRIGDIVAKTVVLTPKKQTPSQTAPK